MNENYTLHSLNEKENGNNQQNENTINFRTFDMNYNEIARQTIHRHPFFFVFPFAAVAVVVVGIVPFGLDVTTCFQT